MTLKTNYTGRVQRPIKEIQYRNLLSRKELNAIPNEGYTFEDVKNAIKAEVDYWRDQYIKGKARGKEWGSYYGAQYAIELERCVKLGIPFAEMGVPEEEARWLLR